MTTTLVLLIILSCFLVPASLLARPEYFLVSLFSVWAMSRQGGLIFKLFRRELSIIAILITLAAVTLAFQILLRGNFAGRDFLILLRYVIYSCAIISGAMLALSYRGGFTLRILTWAIIIVAIAISFIQYFNWMNLNAVTVPIYTANYEQLIEGFSWRRVIGTLGNPNYWGLLLGFGMIISCHRTVARRSLPALVILLLLFVAIIMAGSRGAMIASVSGLAAMGYLLTDTGKSANLGQRTIVIAAFFVVGVALYYGYRIFISDYYANTDRFSLDNTHTLELRFAWWSAFLSKLLESPYQILIGRGPSKSVDVGWADNMYLLILRDFGFPALLAYLYLWFTLLSRLWHLHRRLKKHQPFMITITLSALISFAIFDLAADAWFYVRLSIPMLLAYGFAVTSAHVRLSRISR